MTRRRAKGSHCPNCAEFFSDVWAYKRHQDQCLTPPPEGEKAGPRSEEEDEGEPPSK